MQIVYIEDEFADAQLVERYANLTSHELIVTDNIQKATAAVQASPDLILVDMFIHQSKIGYDFVRDLRAQGYSKPIVAITGLTLKQDIDRCYAVGCDEVLTKPYTINQLADLITRYDTQANA